MSMPLTVSLVFSELRLNTNGFFCWLTPDDGVAARAPGLSELTSARERHDADDVDGARKLLDRVAEVAQDRLVLACALCNLGLLDARDDDVEPSRDRLEDAVELGVDEVTPAALFNIGSRAWGRSSYDEAAEAFERAVGFDCPAVWPDAWLALGRMWEMDENVKESRLGLLAAAAMGDPAITRNALFTLADLEWDYGRRYVVRDIYRRLLRDPDPATRGTTLRSLARLDEIENNRESALALLRQSVKVDDPVSQAEGWVRIGNWMVTEDRLSEARDAYQEAVRVGGPRGRAAGFYGLGKLDQSRGDVAAARAHFEASVAEGDVTPAWYAAFELKRLNAHTAGGGAHRRETPG